ncbi:Lipoprotein releasing system, transmembrane protein, LolC/E family [uncultured Desulfatiglans sp.]|nr:Lipoprotein releasing system, transmembrane protein, LolC/E family [uncultured Desulfatiglans sp.]
MFFELFLGLRYLRTKRKERFISVISVISMVGVMVGVMALIVVLSVMNGFREDLLGKILGVNSHVLLFSYDGPFDGHEAVQKKVEEVPGVMAATPFIYSQVMVNHRGNASGAILRGIDTATAGRVVAIPDMIRGGSLDELDPAPGQPPGIVIGKELARQLGALIGDVVSVLSPEGKLTPLGRAPNTREYRLVGIFDSGMYEYDASMAYVSLSEAQGLLGIGSRVTGLELKVEDPDQSDRLAREVQSAVGPPYWTKDWKQMNKSLFAALKLEKLTMFIILTMIVLVGALNIISTLVMVVMEKTKDVAILRAMGASARSIMAIFMLQGLLVGLVGTVVGLAAGLGLCELLGRYQFIDLPADVYYIAKLPVLVQPGDVLFVAGAAVMISFLATVYPSWHASRLNPIHAIRYE